MPYYIVWQSIDAVAGALGHFGEALGLGLVFKGVTWEIDA